VWVQFQGEGHRQPTYRQMRARLSGNGVRLRNSLLCAQLRHLRRLENFEPPGTAPPAAAGAVYPERGPTAGAGRAPPEPALDPVARNA
jgi:hypothetical protein